MPSWSIPARSPAKRCGRRARPSASLRASGRSARIVVTGCAAQTEPQTFAEMPEVDRVLGNAEKLPPTPGWRRACPGRCALRPRRRGEGSGQRHHGGEGDRAAPDRRHRGPRARLRPGAERLRPPLHLLHHSLRPRQFALGGHGRSGGAGSTPGGERLPRSGAHRRRHHELRNEPSGHAEARPAGASRSSSTCRSSNGCGSPRSTRSRPTPICSMRSRKSRG